jgi:hypothetical protein
MDTLIVNAEKLAYWYFRLNGCFTITNFIVHPDEGRSQRTDIDILAVRFPYREELLINPMKDDPIFLSNGSRMKVILAEVKTNTCNLNGPWTNPERQNMQRVLKAAGVFPREVLDEAAQALYSYGLYEDDSCTMTMFCIGKLENADLRRRFPDVPQVTWARVLDFVYDRFTYYRDQKCRNLQWDKTGRDLFTLVMNSHNKTSFTSQVTITSEQRYNIGKK